MLDDLKKSRYTKYYETQKESSLSLITLQGMRQRTEWMMQEIQRQTVEETYAKWEEAARKYYRQGYDNGESVKLLKELESLGVDAEYLIERDLDIRDEVYISTKKQVVNESERG